MAFRWRNGRFMNETEYNWDKTTDQAMTWSIIAILIPIVTLGCLSWYFFHSSKIVIIGCAVGVVFDIIFRRFIVWLAEILPTILGFVIIFGIIGIIIYSMFTEGVFSK